MNLEKALKIFDYLKTIDENFLLAGSARRGKKEDLHDLDVVYVGEKIPNIPGHAAFVEGKDIVRIMIMDEHVDIYRTNPEYLGGMMLFLTGPMEFNIMTRGLAKRRGMVLNQKGLFNRESKELIASETEEDMFKALGLPYTEPNMRGIKK
jgi:DNA polymerase (family 10)